jgi:hypothetical protein
MASNRDLVGQRFGRLAVIADSGERRGSFVVWECRCDCGATVRVSTGNLRSGNTRSCGCLRREARSADLTGQRFGRLTVMRRLPQPDGRCECRCDCGAATLVDPRNLKSGNTLSCGCLMRELSAERLTTHGMTGTPEHQLLRGARSRATMLGLPCTITLEDIHIPDVCPALGIPLVRATGVMKASSPSLDRLRPSEGYVPGNVVVISELANRIKQNCTSAQVRAVGEWMSSHGL